MTKTYDYPPQGSLSPALSELKLIRQAQEGDADAFGSLYDRHVSTIHRYVYFRVTDAELAEDLTSQVFLKVWQKLGSYKIGGSPFVAWLYRIARNSVIDHYRTTKPVVSLEDVNPVVFSHADEVDEKLDIQIQSQELREALKGLTAGQQQVLTFRFIHGFSTQEIAHRIDKRQGAVRALQMRGLRGLAKSRAFQTAKASDD